MGRTATGIVGWTLILLIGLGSFIIFYHCVDQAMHLGLTHTMIISGEEETADFTAVSDLPVYISGTHEFTMVGETVDFTVTLYDSEGVYLAHTDVHLDSPGYIVETLPYHIAIDYTLTPGAQYTIEVTGEDFEGNVQQPHTPLAEFVLHVFYSDVLIGLVFLCVAVAWVGVLAGVGAVCNDAIKKRRGKKTIQ